MNPIIFALRHPITVMVAIIAIVGGSYLAFERMQVDIFPELDLPVIYVAQPYGGMDPAQMEGLLTNYYEYHFLYITGIHHVESKNIQGVALMKLYFHPGTDMAQAMAETIAYVNRSRAFMPPGHGAALRHALRHRQRAGRLSGAVQQNEADDRRDAGPGAFRRAADLRESAGRVRAAAVRRQSAHHRRQGRSRRSLTPKASRSQEVIAALSGGNTISPSGNMYIEDQTAGRARQCGARRSAGVAQHSDPARLRASICATSATIEDTTDIPTGYALVNGQRTVYMLVTKRADASTLGVVNEVKKNLPRMQAALPEDIDVTLRVRPVALCHARHVERRPGGAAGRVLTGLMVLLFLRDWRSVIVVVLNIPFALLGAVLALWLSGQTINIMTLGGLALAVGILVDEATVEVENIHTQMDRTDSIAWAVRLGNAETAVPRLLAMLCILAVFMPSFFMEGAARALFVPLSLAVGFAMIASYLLSSTFVPVLSVWLLRHARDGGRGARSEDGGRGEGLTSFAKAMQVFFTGSCRGAGRWWVDISRLMALAGWWLLGHPGVGTEIFPAVDAGQFQMRLRAPTGTKFERTEELTREALDVIKMKWGPNNVGISICYVGTIPQAYPINNVYLWTSGPEEAVLRVALKPGSRRSHRGSEGTAAGAIANAAGRLAAKRNGLPKASRRARSPSVSRGLRLSFEPADIVNEVMSFGAPTPIEVAVSGPKLGGEPRVRGEDSRAARRDSLAARSAIRSAAGLSHGRRARGPRKTGPTRRLDQGRDRFGGRGHFVEPLFGAAVVGPIRKTGIGFQVQVEIPLGSMKSEKDWRCCGSSTSRRGPPLRVRDVARNRTRHDAGRI